MDDSLEALFFFCFFVSFILHSHEYSVFEATQSYNAELYSSSHLDQVQHFHRQECKPIEM